MFSTITTTANSANSMAFVQLLYFFQIRLGHLVNCQWYFYAFVNWLCSWMHRFPDVLLSVRSVILLPRHLMNCLSNLDETYRE